MNILVSSVYNYNSYARGIMPDVLQTLIDENPDANIYFLSNSGSFKICYFNIDKKPEVCYLCKSGVKNTLNLISGKFIHILISDVVTEKDRDQAEKFIKNGNDKIFDLMFENFDVGAGTLSTYISTTRDRDLINSDQPFVKELAQNSLALYIGIRRFMAEEKINLVYNFNARHGYVRAVMKAAFYNGIDCINVERTRMGGHIDFFRNQYTHDPKARFDLVERHWENSKLTEKQKKDFGAQFFLLQESGGSFAFPSFTGNMKKGEIPTKFKNGNKNLILFNSSDDEVASFGESFGYPFFKSQNEGLKFLVEFVGKELPHFNLIIRMHPNLKGLKFPYVEEIYHFDQQYPNIFVVAPDSSIDSYALMDSSEKVLTFGSTTGLEANFKRKPVILLGKGFYYFSNYAYKPQSKMELKELLTAPLEPKPLEDTLKIGYYFLHGGVPTKYYNEPKLGEGIYFKGVGIPFYSLPQRMTAKFIKYFSSGKGLIFKRKNAFGKGNKNLF